MRITYVLSIVLGIILLTGCNRGTDRFVQNELYNRSSYWNSPAVLQNIRQRDSLRVSLEAQLEQYNEQNQDRTYLEIIAQLAKIAKSKGAFDECMRYSLEGLTSAEQQKDHEMNAFFQNLMAHVMFDDENYECGGYFANACEQLRNSDDPRLMKVCAGYGIDCFDFYYQLVMDQEADRYLSEALRQANRSYSLNPQVWQESEYDSICGVIYCDRARLCVLQRDRQEAEEWYAKFLETDFSKTISGKWCAVRYLDCSGQEDKGLDIYTELEQIFDTAQTYNNITELLPRMRLIKVNLLWGLKRWQECSEAYENYEVARHYWHKRYTHTKMLDSYEKYSVMREQAQKKDAQIHASRRLAILLVMGFLMFCLVALLVIIYYKERSIKEKNKVLAANIRRMLDEQAANAEDTPEEPKDDNKGGGSDYYDEYQVNRFVYEMKHRQLFCNPDFDRNELLDEMKLTARTFVPSFESMMGMSIANFILNLRLDFAANLIRNNPNVTIDSIALDSGFTSRSTFYRNFTRQFGISPTEFRLQCEEEEKNQ